MLEYVYRYNLKVDMVEAYRDWVVANDTALRDHQPPGWAYLGTWFSVRSFGEFHCESRFQLDGYEALGAGFGDAETQRTSSEFSEYVDWTNKPRAVVYRAAVDVVIPQGM